MRAGGRPGRPECALGHTPRRRARGSPPKCCRGRGLRPRALRRELPAGGAAEDCCAAGSALTWHFIGRVQANKTRAMAEHFAWVHAVDRLQDRRAALRTAPAPCAAAERVPAGEHRAGKPARAASPPGAGGGAGAAVAPLPRLGLRGLMCIPPEESSWRASAPGSPAARCSSALNARRRRLDTLSMGMSGDFEAAIQEGATLVRIGTALFGPRPP